MSESDSGTPAPPPPPPWAALWRAERERKERLLPGASLAFQSRRAGRIATRYFNLHLQPGVSLRSTQLDMLAATASQTNGTISSLARFLGLAASTASRGVARLVRRGLLRLEVGRDRRRRLVRLTDSGQNLLREGEQLLHSIPQARARTYLRPDFLASFREVADRVAETILDQMSRERVARWGFEPLWCHEMRWLGATEEDIHREKLARIWKRNAPAGED